MNAPVSARAAAALRSSPTAPPSPDPTDDGPSRHHRTIWISDVHLGTAGCKAAVDRISLDHHRLSGRAKDLGSAAVFLALMLCLLAWALLAGPALAALAAGALARIRTGTMR